MQCAAHSFDQSIDLSALLSSNDFNVTGPNGSIWLSLCRPLNKIDGQRCPLGAAACLKMANGTLVVRVIYSLNICIYSQKLLQ